MPISRLTRTSWQRATVRCTVKNVYDIPCADHDTGPCGKLEATAHDTVCLPYTAKGLRVMETYRK
jgi:hypothetical protein